MHEIKYQKLKSNAEDTIFHRTNSDANIKDKRYCLLKVLFICLIIIKAIYELNNFETIINWLQSHNNETDISYNQTDKYENTIISLYDEDSATTTASSNITAEDGEGTAENNINTNGYGKIDIVTATSTNAIAFHLNSNNLTTIAAPTTAMYTNNTLITSTLLPTTEITRDLPVSSTTTSTNRPQPMTPPPLKTTDVKLPNPEHKQKYFINTSRCHIPFIDPFTADIRKIFNPEHKTGCTKDQPIITVSFNELDAQYILHINYTVAEGLRNSTNYAAKPIEEDVLCCYQEIIRSGTGSNVDSSFKLLPCTNFHQDFVVPFHINGVIVNCKSKSINSTLQEDAFSFVQVNKTVIRQESQNATNGRRKPSILMIGIDTLSRINFRRNMPETFKYLLANKWYELMGYNKVGDNTLPNIMPMLSGYTKSTAYDKCAPQNVGGFDNCNFIWTTYRNQGYHTAYAEDCTSMSTFNYLLKGFKNPPTDYYFRPIALAIEDTMTITKKAGLKYCLGRKQYGEYIYDYGQAFATRFKNQASFGFFWANSFSHNYYDTSATMDNTMTKYFEEWERRGIFENSVVMFFSDHGIRWGPLLKLPEGFLEERLPMFFISLPKWFRQVYPELVKNLEINQKRLTNSFDIHMTLQHLLQLGEPSYNVQQTLDCPKCQSIFEEIPENRTCDDASIPETWCTCIPFKTESTESEVVKTVANYIIQEMNHYYELKNITSICSPLQLQEITNAKVRYPDELKSSQNITTYAIDFATDPLTEPKALFSATVDYDALNKRIHLNVEDISRQSLYENTAKCTDDKQAKKYCICKNSLKITKT